MIYIIYNENIIYSAFLDYISKKITFNNEEYIFDIVKMKNRFSHIFKFLNYILVINKEYYYTEDSFLYLPMKNIKLKNIYKKKFFIHHEWNDQIILNYNNKSIFRIEKNEEPSLFEDNNENKLIINWNNKKNEDFYKIDEYTYASLPIYNIYKKSLLKIQSIFLPIYIFMHVCCISNWKEIYLDQLNIIKESGLYEKVEYIYIGILGNFNIEDFKDPKIKILYTDSTTNFYEIKTINCIKKFSEDCNTDAYILYIHTKGVRNAGNKDAIRSWRKMMEYFLIEYHEKCLTFLEDYDTLGCNVINKGYVRINKDHSYHYSGNFWWSKKSYIKNLPYLKIELSEKSVYLRFRAENWILSAYPNTKVGIIFQDNTNTHPYNQIIFDYYKEMNFFVKNLLEWNKEII